MKKFLAFIKIGMADGLEYRFQLTYWLLLNMIPMILMIALWSAIYGEKETFGPYSLAMMVTYYVTTKFINRITTTYSEGRIAKDIKDGNLNQFLARPMNYSMLKFGERLGIRVVNMIIFIPGYALAYLLLYKYIVPPVDGIAIFLVTVNTLINIISHFLLARILGSAAFFMLETHALFGLKENVVMLASGYMFPIFLFPEVIQKILLLTPFPYYYYFPMQIYFGLLSQAEIIQGFTIQFLWMIALFLIGEWIWKKGLQRYEGVGV